MAVSDSSLIAEVMLQADGFRSAREIGSKVVTLFALSQQVGPPFRVVALCFHACV